MEEILGVCSKVSVRALDFVFVKGFSVTLCVVEDEGSVTGLGDGSRAVGVDRDS